MIAPKTRIKLGPVGSHGMRRGPSCIAHVAGKRCSRRAVWSHKLVQGIGDFEMRHTVTLCEWCSKACERMQERGAVLLDAAMRVGVVK